MSQDNIITPLSVKSPRHIFLHELENEFELFPKEARGILESAKTIFNLEGACQSGNLCRGQMKEIVLTEVIYLATGHKDILAPRFPELLHHKGS